MKDDQVNHSNVVTLPSRGSASSSGGDVVRTVEEVAALLAVVSEHSLSAVVYDVEVFVTGLRCKLEGVQAAKASLRGVSPQMLKAAVLLRAERRLDPTAGPGR